MIDVVGAARAMAETMVEPVRTELRRGIRRWLGVPPDPPPPVTTDAFIPPGSVVRRVHGDLGPMMAGGLAALLLQTLHPLAMAGVADHSDYRSDAAGRLRRTAAFVGVTTFGSRQAAEEAIAHVRRVHRGVRGIAPDGRPYSADDPELLTWVHVAEMWSFLQAAQRYGRHRLTAEDGDRYFAETAIVARALGAEWVPRRVDEAAAYFARVRPHLYAGPQAMAARTFLLRGIGTRPCDRAAYGALVAAAVPLLPRWARAMLRLPAPPLFDDLVVVPAARAACAAVRWTTAPASAGT